MDPYEPPYRAVNAEQPREENDNEYAKARFGLRPTSRPAYRTRQVIWLIVSVIGIFLSFDFFFRAAGANDTGFASFVYFVAGALAWPFAGIFGTSQKGAHAVAWADAIGLVIYIIAGWIIVRIMVIADSPRAQGPVP